MLGMIQIMVPQVVSVYYIHLVFLPFKSYTT